MSMHCLEIVRNFSGMTRLQILQGGELVGYAVCEVNWGQIMKELLCYNEGGKSQF